MLKFSVLTLALLPLAAPMAHAGDTRVQPIPNQTTVLVKVSLECVVQPDMTVKDCVALNAAAIPESDVMDAVHAVEAKNDPVPSGKPGDKVKIVMTLDH